MVMMRRHSCRWNQLVDVVRRVWHGTRFALCQEAAPTSSLRLLSVPSPLRTTTLDLITLLAIAMATASEGEHGAPPLKRRRIPKACAACRRSKLRCDERRPCSRCINSNTDCVYLTKAKDPMAERIEYLEAQLNALSRRMDVATDDPLGLSSILHRGPQLPHQGTSVSSAPPPSENSSSLAHFAMRQTSTADAIDRGIVTEADARGLFAVFFEGCVPYAQLTFLKSRSHLRLLKTTQS